MKIKLFIWKISILDIVKGDGLRSKIILDDIVKYSSKKSVKKLKQNLATMYGVTSEYVETELEYEYKILDMAVSHLDYTKTQIGNSSAKPDGTHNLVAEVFLHEEARRARKNLGARRRVVTKLERDYDKQGLWRKK
jgi:hypothetical protein